MGMHFPFFCKAQQNATNIFRTPLHVVNNTVYVNLFVCVLYCIAILCVIMERYCTVEYYTR